jgi:hypothetical protein
MLRCLSTPLVALACAALALAGCGQGGRKPVHTVTGKVLDGNKKPAAGATLLFHPVKPDPGDPAKPVGLTDEQGIFRLTTYEKGDGAPEGEYVVTVEWRPPKKTPFDPEPADRLAGRYANPKTSRLRARVEKQATELPPFVVELPR